MISEGLNTSGRLRPIAHRTSCVSTGSAPANTARGASCVTLPTRDAAANNPSSDGSRGGPSINGPMRVCTFATMPDAANGSAPAAWSCQIMGDGGPLSSIFESRRWAATAGQPKRPAQAAVDTASISTSPIGLRGAPSTHDPSSCAAIHPVSIPETVGWGRGCERNSAPKEPHARPRRRAARPCADRRSTSRSTPARRVKTHMTHHAGRRRHALR